MLRLLMLFHTCEHTGFASPSVVLCGCQKLSKAQGNSLADAVFAEASHEPFCTVQQEIDEPEDL